MPLIRVSSDEPPSRETMERAFEQAEASLRLEGMTPTEVFFKVKERVLAGEITLDQGAEEINAHHTQMEAREAGRRLLELGGTAPDIEDVRRRR
jgi:hypothetical protein